MNRLTGTEVTKFLEKHGLDKTYIMVLFKPNINVDVVTYELKVKEEEKAIELLSKEKYTEKEAFLALSYLGLSNNFSEYLFFQENCNDSRLSKVFNFPLVVNLLQTNTMDDLTRKSFKKSA